VPHLRSRHLRQILLKTLRFSPIVGVFGHRQVGKTTLCSGIGGEYQSLDDVLTLNKINSDPTAYLESLNKSPTVLDECQMAPALFPALKERVRKKQSPGQFLLTGSVRFSSRRQIRESLTGRIISWELLPMDLAEINEEPLPDSIPKLLKSKTVEIDLKGSDYLSEGSVTKYLQKGGLPGVFAVRDEAILKRRFETQLETLLERDLRLLIETSLGYPTLRSLMVELALSQGAPLDWTALARKTRISRPTLTKLLNAFESMYLIRRVPTVGSAVRPSVYFEDQGEASFLSKVSLAAPLGLTELTNFLYAHLKVQVAYRPELALQIFQFRNRNGAFVPLCLQGPLGTLGFIPSLEENPSIGTLHTARAFLKRFVNPKLIVFHAATTDKTIDRQIRVIGLNRLV
jgi:uncharacterized protein